MQDLSISLQDEQFHKIEELRLLTNNPDVTNEFVAGILLNTLLRDDPDVFDLGKDLVARFVKTNR